MTTPKAVFIALVVLALAQAGYYYPQLPETVASHFDGAGHANGWSSKAEFFGVMFGMMALMGLVFLGMPKMISRVPANWISLPYRDYWLSEERRADTMRFIDDQMSWLGVATMLLIVATTQFTIDANLRHHPELPLRFMWVVWVYLGYSLAWTVYFILHFVRVRKQQNAI
jgi:uncharacterized membrane protein